MTPRKLIEWGIAISALVVFLGFLATLFSDLFYYRQFPRLETLLGSENLGILPILFVVVASVLATFVVLLFRYTRGSLEFNALGVKFTGPSGPILLWVVSFMAVSAALIAFVSTIPVTKKQYQISTEQPKLEKNKIDSVAKQSQPNNPTTSNLKMKAQDNFIKKQKTNKVYYDVILFIPSAMSGGDILVDGQPAAIIDQKLMMVTIRVEAKETNHQITIKKGDQSCTKEILIRQNNLRLQPCQG